MSIKINLGEETPLESKPVILGSVGEFHVHLRRPKFAELVSDISNISASDYVLRRMKSVVVGWAGLTQDAPTVDGTGTTEQEIPFSWESLERVCEMYPQAFQQIARHAADVFRGTDSKNVRPASALFSADAVIQQMAPSFGSSSGVSGGSPAAPA